MADMFDSEGRYVKTEWRTGDRITSEKMNKIELSLEAINNNVSSINSSVNTINSELMVHANYINAIDNEVSQKVSKSSLVVNVNDHFIYGDGETDITSKLNDLIGELSNYTWEVDNETSYSKVKPIKLYFPRGKYIISDTINLSPYVTLEGEFTSLGNNYKINELNSGLVDFSDNGTSFICRLTDNRKFAFNISAFHSDGLRDTDISRVFNGPSSQLYDRLEGVTIKNIQIIADKHLFGGLYCVGSPFLTLENVNVLGADIGIYISSLWNGRVTNCGFHCKNYAVIGYKDVNNVSFTGCSIEHYYMYKNNGEADTVYDTSNLSILYPAEGNHMPVNYVSITTGIYLFCCWQISFSNCTVQNFKRGLFGFQSNVSLDNIWFESVKVVDIHSIFCNISLLSCRKETNTSNLLRATGGSLITITNMSGSNDRGIWLGNDSKIIDYVDNDALINFIGCPRDMAIGHSTVVADRVVFKGMSTLSGVVKTEITITANQVGTEVSIAFPNGFDKTSTAILSVLRHQTNGVIYVENNLPYYMHNNGITFKPTSAGKHDFMLMKIT